MDEIIGEFLIESYEGLDRLDQSLIVLEESPDDTETLTEIFRILHTIKGTCGFLAFHNLERVAHRGESLLSLLRDHVMTLNSDITDALLATVDAIREILGVIEATEEEGDNAYPELVARLEALAESSEHDAGVDAPPPTPTEPAATLAPVEAAAAGPAEGADWTIPAPDAPATNDEQPAAAPEAPAAEADAPVAEADNTADASPTPPPVPQERLGDMLVDDGEASRTDVEIAAAEQSLGDDRKIGKILVDEGKATKKAVEGAASRQSGASDSTIRVDVTVLDNLMNLVGELVLARNQIAQLAANSNGSAFDAPAQRLNLVTTELQESVMQTRMQPIGSIWNKFPRVVRDLAHQFDKDVKLEMTGKGTELDRTIIEAIKDPLTHMVRNTIDHGIESAEDRVAAGKPAGGTLYLRAYHEGGRVNIEIADDGKGIDPDAMTAKAVEKGVITAEQASRMSDTDAVQLIFAPGFSTAEKVSNVSGRGVGMDVVRTNVERIGGSVEVITALGQGTTFKIKIPLTLAIVPAITVKCAGSKYAIPQLSLQGLVRLDEHDESQRIEDVHGAPVYRLRGRLLPIVDLRKQLGAEPSEKGGATNIVVLNADGRSFGLIVDEIEDTAEIVVKPLGRAVKAIDVFAGATVMGDGTVALILDVMGLATAAHIVGAEAGAPTASAEPVEEETQTDEDETFVVIDLGHEQNAAVSLADVDRLEEFSESRIERTDHRHVVQYHDGLLPIIDLSSTLGGEPILGAGRDVSVVVCEIESQRVGLAVHGITDIVDRPKVHRGISGRPERAIIDGNVTDVVNVYRTVTSQLGDLFTADSYSSEGAWA